MSQVHILGSLVLVVALTACAGPTGEGRPAADSGPDGPGAPRRMVAAVRSSPTILFYNKLNPGRSVLGTSDFERLLHAGLAQEDDGGNVYPQLAESVPSLENRLWTVFPDGRMETTWKVKEQARWHDGTPFTTADLRFTAHISQDPDLPLREQAFQFVDSIEATDAHTLTVGWNQPFVEADRLFSYTRALPIPVHLVEPVLVEDKENLVQHPYWGTEFVGAGPFKLQEVVPGSHLVFAANDQYVLGRPKIDLIEVRFFQDPNVILANFLAGEVEYVFDARSISLEQGAQLRDRWTDGTVELGLGGWVSMFPQFFDPRPPVVADPQFRRALVMGINREEMVDALQYGLGEVGHSFVHPLRTEYPNIEPRIVRYPYDPRQAGQLLEGLGYTRGSDGALQDASGQRLKIEIWTTVTDINSRSTTAVADYWQQLGLEVEQFIVPPQRAPDREWRVTFPAFELLRTGSNIAAFDGYHSREIPTAQNRWSGQNRGRYHSPQMDTLIDRYWETIPMRERADALGQIVHLMTDQQLRVGLMWDPAVVPVSKRLRNAGAGGLWRSHEWEVE